MCGDDSSSPYLADAAFAALVSDTAELLWDEAFDIFQVVDVACAVGELNVPRGRLWGAIAHEAGELERLEELDTRRLANLAWAFAKAGVESPNLFAMIAKVVCGSPKRLAELSLEDLANLVWAFETVCVELPHFFASIAIEAGSVRRFEEDKVGDAQAVANKAWELVAAGVDPKGEEGPREDDVVTPLSDSLRQAPILDPNEIVKKLAMWRRRPKKKPQVVLGEGKWATLTKGEVGGGGGKG